MKRRKQESRKTLVDDARAVVQHCPVLGIRLAERRISRFMEAQLRNTGLSIPQFSLMAHVAAARNDTIGALADRLGLDQSTLSRNLRSLEQSGLLEIAIVEKDLRRRAVWLTERGAVLLEAALPAWRKSHAAMAAIVNSTAVRILAEKTTALDQITAGMAEPKAASHALHRR